MLDRILSLTNLLVLTGIFFLGIVILRITLGFFKKKGMSSLIGLMIQASGTLIWSLGLFLFFYQSSADRGELLLFQGIIAITLLWSLFSLVTWMKEQLERLDIPYQGLPGILRGLLAGLLLYSFLWAQELTPMYTILIVVLLAGIAVIGVAQGQKILLRLFKDSYKLSHRLLLSAFSGPVRVLIVASALYLVRPFLSPDFFMYSTYLNSTKILLTLSFFLFFYRLSENVGHNISRMSESTDNSMDKTQVEIVRFTLRIILILLTLFIIIQQVTGRNLNSILAGLGIGGIALALGVQDVLKNFFGSFMIFADKPFKIGERVQFENYDGIIENIGFRSTRLRTLTGNLVVVPNEKVASVSIENVGKRESIRRMMDLKIPYGTPTVKIEALLERLRALLADHRGMLEDFPPRVFFSDLDTDALNIRILFWFSPPAYWEYMAFCEEINLEIIRIFEELGVDFAFPTRTQIIQYQEKKNG